MNLSNSSKSLFFRYNLLFFFGLLLFFIYYVQDNAFFWDTIQLGSLHAHFYYENNFSNFFLPENMDSGHPPLFGMYIAFLWKFFGKTLAVSHFAMLPFLFGIIFYLQKLGQHFGLSKWLIVGFIFLNISDPCVAGQAALVSPDIVLLLFFLMCMYGILSQKKIHIVFGVVGLCVISTRGMMTAAALFLFEVLNHFWLEKKSIKFKSLISKGMPFVPGVILGISFLVTHYIYTGWIGYHENSPWAPAFEKVNVEGFVKNMAILGWRFLDFGRVFLFAIIAFLGFSFFRKKTKLNQKTKQLFLIFSCLFIFLIPSQVLHQMLLGHRYLLPLLLVINFLTVYWISIFSGKRKNTLFIFAIVGLTLGNFWIYPKKIAQGWDSTLAMLPYFDLRKEMIQFIEMSNISFKEVGTVFPNLQTFEITDLNGNLNRFAEKGFQKNKFIFYSNVFNDFSDEEIDTLENDWTVKKQLKRNGICVVLYENKNLNF